MAISITKAEGSIARIYHIPQYHPPKGIQYQIKHTVFGWGCYGRLPHSEKISPSTSSRVILFLLVVIYRNTLNQRQYALYYTECPSEGGIAEGGIAGCGISLQYHPLLWWAGLRKVREKYHIYTYQWNYWIIKEICIKYNIHTYYLIFSKAQGLVVECTLNFVELGRYEDLFTLENSYFYQPNVVYE